MAITINGSGTISGISTGGLPDGSVDADTLATDSVTSAKLKSDAITVGDLPSGSVLQVVTADVVSSSTTSSSFTDSGTSITVTPVSSTSTLIVSASFSAYQSMTSGILAWGQYAITDSSNTALTNTGARLIGHEISTSYAGTQYSFPNPSLVGYTSSGSTTSRTYKIRYRAGASGTTTQISSGTMIVMEIAG